MIAPPPTMDVSTLTHDALYAVIERTQDGANRPLWLAAMRERAHRIELSQERGEMAAGWHWSNR